ncbi:cystathionine gamma-lyase [Sulfobacillus thermosulfidooxidans DSM 9293]|uniref:Cystathionine gamma-lyase n=1 Tax=Sulfobacillus thermosulfidooxidans (strain DSM 9293 / VKM B-1269 / AT-1) TaxID=929705 RepID=A0A1W1W8Y0_SULTA|nr:cystathionine gamma-lyase [Sulfobacillus thermosulfidooxidans DSM 9293]
MVATANQSKNQHEEWGFSTRAIHQAQTSLDQSRATTMPIYQTSTYTQVLDGTPVHYEYGRGDSPNREALEDTLTALENGQFAVVFGSGMAACDAILRHLNPGDHIIAGLDLYGGVYRLLEQVYRQHHIAVDYCTFDTDDWVTRIRPTTRLVWLETPTNPLLHVIDIERVTQKAHLHDLTVVVDNTFASPYLQNPLCLGADLVVHSMTKYIAGHSDVIGGVVIGGDARWRESLQFLRNATGPILGPFDAWLILRGVKTLALRMQQHTQNALHIVQFLKTHPRVSQLYYPEGQVAYSKQMRGGGGMISFVLKDADTTHVYEVLRKFRVFAVAESLGGVESLVSHPATMTHSAIPEEERNRRGIVPGLIRLSVGIEDVKDLIADLEHALD